jgi:hypothetical protein
MAILRKNRIMKLFAAFFLVFTLFACSETPDNSAETTPEEAIVPDVPEAPQPQPSDGTDVVKAKPAAAPDTHTAPKNKDAESKLLDDIMAMPEIRELSETVKNGSGGKHKVKAYVAARPSDDAEYYTVDVAEDNGGALTTLHIFRVYPDETVVYDVARDKEVSLKEWRRSLR